MFLLVSLGLAVLCIVVGVFAYAAPRSAAGPAGPAGDDDPVARERGLENAIFDEIVARGRSGIDVSSVCGDGSAGEADRFIAQLDQLAGGPGKAFHASRWWKRVRRRVVEEQGPVCLGCGRNVYSRAELEQRAAGAEPDLDAMAQVDHIKPRSRYPELAWSYDNLQLLCAACNAAKGDTVADYRGGRN